MDYEDIRKKLNELGFFRINHLVVVHHMLKDFVDYEVIKAAFYIKPVGIDFLHVAVVQYRTSNKLVATKLKYTCAADDLLYGLKVKFREGSVHTSKTLEDIELLSKETGLAGFGDYVRERFGKTRNQAKVRALFVMLKDKWRQLFSF